MKHSYKIKTVYVGHRVYKIINGFSIRVNTTVKENTSDEFIERKINDILGNNTELKKK